MAIDHDQIFKNLIRSFFQEFMELFLPEVAELFDFGKVEFLEQELYTDVPRGRLKRLDLVVKVGLKGGGEKYVLVHNEFKAQKDWSVPETMFGYFCQLYLRHRKAVVPVVVFSDDAKWRKPIPDAFSIGLKERNYVDFRYHLIKLKNLDYRSFLESDNPLAFALMAKMEYNRRQRVRLKADFLRLILGAGVDRARESLLVDFVETYMRLNRKEESQYQKLVSEKREYKEVQTMITTYERRGEKRGEKRGERSGRLNEKRAILVRLLGKKFGKLEDGIAARIERTTSGKKLDSLLLAVLDAESVDQLGI